MLPKLTHLQYLILGCLADGEAAGVAIRESIASRGVRKSGPGFYQLMARLEDAKLVRGWYDSKVLDGQPIKERRYKLLPAGRKALEEIAAFYAK